MYSVFAPVAASHLRRSSATNSGPLSERRCSGTPFITITSANAPITFALLHLRSHRIIRHSRVFIDQIQHPCGAPVMCLCTYEVVAPLAFRPETHAQSIVEP